MAIEYGNQTLGRGELRFSRFKTGTYTPEGFRYLGNSPSFSLTVASTNLDHYSSDHGVREKDKSIAVEVNRTAKFDADDIQLDNLAYFFFGSKATVTQTSSTANTETFTGVIQGPCHGRPDVHRGQPRRRKHRLYDALREVDPERRLPVEGR
jgi:hypothetical protein